MYGLVCGMLMGMCAKVSQQLTSFKPASFLLVWDPIFGFKCMMFDVLLPYLFLLCMARDLGYMLRRCYLYLYAHMVFGF